MTVRGIQRKIFDQYIAWLKGKGKEELARQVQTTVDDYFEEGPHTWTT